jgi:PIN domain nuclease of toxin-antitoxin system
LDTHVLLWTIGKSDELSHQVTELIRNKENDVFVSAISLWEIAIKHSVKKLELNFAVVDIPKYCQKMGFELIPLKPLEALAMLKLPAKQNHKDPFDRILIYQCIAGNYTLISKDEKMKYYLDDGLKCIW